MENGLRSSRFKFFLTAKFAEDAKFRKESDRFAYPLRSLRSLRLKKDANPRYTLFRD